MRPAPIRSVSTTLGSDMSAPAGAPARNGTPNEVCSGSTRQKMARNASNSVRTELMRPSPRTESIRVDGDPRHPAPGAATATVKPSRALAARIRGQYNHPPMPTPGSTQDVTPLFAAFREAARHLWNTAFYRPDAYREGGAAWDRRDAFSRVIGELFTAMILDPLAVTGSRLAPDWEHAPPGLPDFDVRPSEVPRGDDRHVRRASPARRALCPDRVQPRRRPLRRAR